MIDNAVVDGRCRIRNGNGFTDRLGAGIALIGRDRALDDKVVLHRRQGGGAGRLAGGDIVGRSGEGHERGDRNTVKPLGCFHIHLDSWFDG